MAMDGSHVKAMPGLLSRYLECSFEYLGILWSFETLCVN